MRLISETPTIDSPTIGFLNIKKNLLIINDNVEKKSEYSRRGISDIFDISMPLRYIESIFCISKINDSGKYDEKNIPIAAHNFQFFMLNSLKKITKTPIVKSN